MSSRTFVTGLVICLVAVLAGGFVVAGLRGTPQQSSVPTGSVGVSKMAPGKVPPQPTPWAPKGNSLQPGVVETYTPQYPTLPCTWLDGQCIPTMGGKG